MDRKPQICDFMQNKEKTSVMCRKSFAVLIYSNSIKNYFYIIWNITLPLIFKREKECTSSHCPHYYSLHRARGKKKIKEGGAKTNRNSLKQQFWKGSFSTQRETRTWVSSSTLQSHYAVPETQNDLQLRHYTSSQTYCWKYSSIMFWIAVKVKQSFFSN